MSKNTNELKTGDPKNLVSRRFCTRAPPPVTDPRIHADSSLRHQVQRLIKEDEALDGVVTSARAYYNDVELWVNREASDFLGALSCDQQRDYAASHWLKWSKMKGVAAGSGVTIKSYTGRVLASAEEGFTGPRFHCE